MKCYISKNYSNYTNAGNKAKTDIETIIHKNGFINIGLKQSSYSNTIISFLITLSSIIKSIFYLHKDDWLLLQYPFKKYYTFICILAHFRGAKVITVIHDLGSFRRKKLTETHEIWKLNHSDAIIAHNKNMRLWLLQHDCHAEIKNLQIFDYLSDAKPTARISDYDHYKVLYAGGLAKRKNSYLYEIGKYIHSYEFYIYGKGLETESLHESSHVHYKNFLPSDQLIESAEGDFGLLWEGNSLQSCCGDFGEYIKYNNPHKASLYIRCNLPIIVWSEAALADFILQNKIGFCIDSLESLDDKLKKISPKYYSEMKENTLKMSQRLSQGYYIMQAINQIIN